MFKKFRSWKQARKQRQEIREAEMLCEKHGHHPMFSKRSELYWFGMPCQCVRCGSVIPCPDEPVTITV